MPVTPLWIGPWSRRRFLGQWAGLTAWPLCVRAAAQVPAYPAIRLLKEFHGAQLYTISLNGKLACLYYFRHLQMLLQRWSYDGGSTKRTDDVLRVIELDTGKAIYATQLRSMVVSASFFADGESLYVETFPMLEGEGSRVNVYQEAVIDLRTRDLQERLAKLGRRYYALSRPLMLGIDHSMQTSRAESLALTALPEYKELMQVPFAAVPEPENFGHPALSGDGRLVYGHDTDPVVSADRRKVVYGAGHSLVCRRAEDLGVLWTRQIGPEYYGAWLLDLTPNGSRVVAAFIDDTFIAKQRKFSVGVYNGNDGSVVTELPLNGFEGVSISADGNFIGVSQRAPLGDGRVQPTVDVYDVASGRQVGKVIHPSVHVDGRGQLGNGSIGSRFTPDGKYLITSCQNTVRVWEFGGRR